MKIYNKYIVTRRFKKTGICGKLNLPFGTECYADGGFIRCNHGAICSISSQNAYDHFSQNDDGFGIQRGIFIRSILNVLTRDQDVDSYYQQRWDRVWNDTICLKYKREEYDDFWVWSYDFYNAPIGDLKHIAKLVGVKECA